MELAAPAIHRNELDGTFTVSLGSHNIGPVLTLNDCHRLSDILLIRQAVSGGLSPSCLKLHRSLQYYQLDAKTLGHLNSISLESMVNDLQQQLKQNPTKPTATAMNSEPAASLSDHAANNFTPFPNPETNVNRTRQSTPHSGTINNNGKVDDHVEKGKKGKSMGSLRKRATPVPLLRPLPSHLAPKDAENEYGWMVNGDSEEVEVEEGRKIEEMAQDSKNVSLQVTAPLLEDDEMADQVEEEEVETSKLQEQNQISDQRDNTKNLLSPQRQAPFRGILKQENFTASNANTATWKTILSISSNSLLMSDDKASHSSSDPVSLSVYSISDPTEAALIFDLTCCWRARRRGNEISDGLKLNFAVKDIESNPEVRPILDYILGPQCAYVKQLSGYLQTLAEEGTLLKILDPKARKDALVKYGCGDTSVAITNNNNPSVVIDGDSGQKTSAKGTAAAIAGGAAPLDKDDEGEVINLVSDEDEEEPGEEEAKDKEKTRKSPVPVLVNTNKKRKSNEIMQTRSQPIRTLLTARKSAFNYPHRKATPTATATATAAAVSPASLADHQDKDGNKKSRQEVPSNDDFITSEIRSFLESNKFLDRTEISEYMAKFEGITDITAFKQWQLKTLQGVAGEGTGKTVGKYIKRALITRISDE